MTLDPGAPAVLAARGKLTPYGALLLEQAGRLALRIHADDVGVEHLLCAILADEDCAACEVVLHAFADPASIHDEALAHAAGILVVGSARAQPFSTHAVTLLYAARATAVAAAREVAPPHLLLESLEHVGEDLRAALVEAGFDVEGVRAALRTLPVGCPATEEGPLFRSFSNSARQVLARAARESEREELDAVSPGCVLLAALETETGLEKTSGVTIHRARRVCGGRLADPSPPPARQLQPDAALEALLRGLAPGAGSLELLATFHRGETPELALLLNRHKVTTALLDRCRGTFRDPDPPADR